MRGVAGSLGSGPARGVKVSVHARGLTLSQTDRRSRSRSARAAGVGRGGAGQPGTSVSAPTWWFLQDSKDDRFHKMLPTMYFNFIFVINVLRREEVVTKYPASLHAKCLPSKANTKLDLFTDERGLATAQGSCTDRLCSYDI